MSIIKIVKRVITVCYLNFLKVFVKPKNQVLFNCFHGKQYSDNPRAISEKLHSLFPEIQIAWFIEKGYKLDLPEYVRPVERLGRFTLAKEILGSFCYVTNYDLGKDIRKNNNQLFIQTWHGDIGLKKVLYEAWDDGKRPEPVYDEFLTDYCIAGSKQGEIQYRNAFHYKGRILKVGSPRNDILLNKDQNINIAIRDKYNIPYSAKILLFAPTFRDNSNGKQEVLINLNKVLSILNSKDHACKWVCLVRAHIASSGLDFADNDSIIDVTGYKDMADLLSIADMLITDYSSCAGDFLLTKRPTILAFFDQKEYLESCRSFQFDPYEAGFFIAETQDALEEIIQNLNDDMVKQNCEQLIKRFEIVTDGCASKRVAELIHRHYELLFSKNLIS